MQTNVILSAALEDDYASTFVAGGKMLAVVAELNGGNNIRCKITSKQTLHPDIACT